MTNENLVNYIKKCREQGFSDEVIKIALLEAGWKEEDVEEGFKNGGVPGPKIKWGKLLPIIIVIIVILAGLFAIYQFSTWFNFLK